MGWGESAFVLGSQSSAHIRSRSNCLARNLKPRLAKIMNPCPAGGNSTFPQEPIGGSGPALAFTDYIRQELPAHGSLPRDALVQVACGEEAHQNLSRPHNLRIEPSSLRLTPRFSLSFKMALDSFFHNKIESMKLEIIQGQAVLRRLEAQRNDYNSRGMMISGIYLQI